jgi:dihydroorotate dehydrogenase
VLYQKIARPFFFCLNPELAHKAVLGGLTAGSKISEGPWLLKKTIDFLEGPPPLLPCSVAGISFPNPIGLAAGMDKNGVALLAWESLGFGEIWKSESAPETEP